MGDVGQQTQSSSVIRAIRVLGDRWSLLIIRDAFQGVHRFHEFLARTGTSRATLTNRLRSLVDHGIFKRVLYTSTPPRHEYRLTTMGRDLFGLSLIAWRWERHWAPRGAGIPLTLKHAECDHAMEPELVCAHCREQVAIRDTYLLPGPGKRTRIAPTERYRRISALNAASHRGSHRELTHIADIVGDPWTPLVLATAFFGLRRFDDMQRELGIATNVLADRLELLVREKIFTRGLYMRRPQRHEYRLTDKGRDLYGFALMQMAWGDRWLAPGAAPYLIFHRNCARQLHPAVCCSHCKAEIVAGTVHPYSKARLGKASVVSSGK